MKFHNIKIFFIAPNKIKEFKAANLFWNIFPIAVLEILLIIPLAMGTFLYEKNPKICASLNCCGPVCNFDVYLSYLAHSHDHWKSLHT
jgi:hypothetical protein